MAELPAAPTVALPDAPPAEYGQIGMFLVVSGIANLMLGAISSLAGLSVCCSTYGICFFCPVLGVVPAVWGVFEILEGNRVRAGERSPGVRTTNLVGLVLAVMMFHMVGVILQALVMMHLGDPKVRAWLDQEDPG